MAGGFDGASGFCDGFVGFSFSLIARIPGRDRGQLPEVLLLMAFTPLYVTLIDEVLYRQFSDGPGGIRLARLAKSASNCR